MNSHEKWIKGSILGAAWGSSEIVVGSFLHNLQVPFIGNILTALAIILFVSTTRRWPQRGLFWRAGLVCAFLKTLSPSAVVFGPMVAIVAQGFLMELSVLVAGPSLVGFALGGMLSMSWNLVQKVLNYLIAFGPNIVIVYKSLIVWTQKLLPIRSTIFWAPLGILLALYMVFGFLAAWVGLVLAKRIEREPNYSLPSKIKSDHPFANDTHFRFSSRWMFSNVALTAGMLMAIGHSPWFVWIPLVVLLVSVWSRRYKRAFRQLARLRFWIWFAAITTITTLLFSSYQGIAPWNALLIGIQMNFRAAVILLGFTVLGTELYSPSIKKWLSGSRVKHFSLAIDIALENLPILTSAVGSPQQLFRRPNRALGGVVAIVHNQFLEHSNSGMVYMVTGIRGAGKTTFVRELARLLQAEGIAISGIISLRQVVAQQTIGYNIQNIATGQERPLLRMGNTPYWEQIGRYKINPEGLRFGQHLLESLNTTRNRIVIIDEVGALELGGSGWAQALTNLATQKHITLILTVRATHFESVATKWDFQKSRRLEASMANPAQIAQEIMHAQGLLRAFPNEATAPEAKEPQHPIDYRIDQLANALGPTVK